MKDASTIATARATRLHEHLVEFYETDGFLVASAADFVGAALRRGGAGIVIATPGHRLDIAATIASAGVDLDAAIDDGRFVELDAVGMLARVIVDGMPAEHAFADVVGPLLHAAAAEQREVRIYGEVVALLLGAGNVRAAIAFEDLWNDLGEEHDFKLLCGYPLEAFNRAASGPFREICARHTVVVPAESYSLVRSSRERQRIVAELQQERAWLRASLARLLEEHDSLIELAYRDPLTGLANRRAFDEHLAREWALARRDAKDSFVLVMDLDGFKALNDRFGHATGDDALRAFAEALCAAARSTDIVARLGGDEFAVLLVRCDERATHGFRHRLREELARRILPRAGPLRMSAGHASLRHSDSPESAIDRADLAMLAAKRGRQRKHDSRLPRR